MTHGPGQRLAAEAIGSGLLVATVIGSGIMAENLAQGLAALALLANTLATGAMLFVLVTILGPVSGAHFNPAVSMVFALRREMRWRAALGYLPAQVGGAMVGALLAHAMFGLPLAQVATTQRAGAALWLSEAVATFMLVIAILGALRSRPGSVAIVVALTIVAGYWFTASTSFANPAVTIARSLTDTFAGIAPGDAPGFIAAQFAGAIAAWLLAERLFCWKPGADEQPSLSGAMED